MTKHSGIPGLEFDTALGRLEALFDSYREVAERLLASLKKEEQLLVHLRGQHAHVIQEAIICTQYEHRLELLPALIENAGGWGSHRDISSARSIIRTLPKTALEREVVEDLERLIAGMVNDSDFADYLAPFADLLVEQGLSDAVKRLRELVLEGDSRGTSELLAALEGVESDPSRWLLDRQEQRELNESRDG